MSRLFLKPASDGLYHHSYTPSTVVSMDFADPVVSRCIETVDSDKFNKIAVSGEMQLAPQIFPPYGDLYFRSAAFYVPEHQIFSASEAFHSNDTLYKGRAFKLPIVRPYEILNKICSDTTNGFATLVQTLSESTSGQNPYTNYPAPKDYDFIDLKQGIGGVLDYKFYKLTATGYRYYRFLKSLGYDFVTPPWLMYDTVPTQYSYRKDWIEEVYCNYFASALPILAFCKVYIDYFMPGQFFNRAQLVEFMQSIHDNVAYNSSPFIFNSSTGFINSKAVLEIYNICKTPVLQSMYTSAWNSPNSPLGLGPADYGSFNNGSIISPYLNQQNNSTDSIIDGQNGVYSRSNNTGNLLYITSFGQRIQKAVEQFIIRNNLVGTRPAQRMLARFGRKPNDATAHFVSKLYEGSDKIQFHPVVSNTNNVSSGTTQVGEGLGDLAGFSKAGFNFEFGYESSDYGFILVIHWLQIKPILMHGQDPMTMRLNPFDWFTPEYDGQALRAIPMNEISIQKDKRTQVAVTADLKHDQEIYGFTNLYQEYREMRDLVCGDFLNGNSKNFLFARDYTKFRSEPGYTLKPQSNDIQLITGGGFTQPFQMADSVGDRFWLDISFDIEAERPIKTTSDALMLNGSGSVEVPMNGTANS